MAEDEDREVEETVSAAGHPCATCPYLRTSPLGLWDATEFENLVEHDLDEVGGAAFGCHKKDGSLCRGWLADQKRRGVPSIQLRLRLCTDPSALATFEAVDEQDPSLYDSITEMVRANHRRPFPARDPRARHLAAQKRLARTRR